MVTEIFSTVGEIITGVAQAFTTVFSSIAGVFYDDTKGLTIVGVLALLGFGVAVVKWGFSLILRLLKMGK